MSIPVKRTIALLLVEDEPNPRKLMALNLARVGQGSHLKPVACFAATINVAIRWLRTRPFDVISLDMRMPSQEGSAILVSTGVSFAGHAIVTSAMSKPLVFSITIEVEVARAILRDALEVAGAAVDDKYAKSECSGSPNESTPFESLTYLDWAKRIHLYAETNAKTLPSPGGIRLSTAGNWLKIGQQVLPPLLARHVAWMDRHWDARSAPPLDAAHRFIETCERLALAQTAVVLQAAGVNVATLSAPNAWQRKGVQDALGAWRRQLAASSLERQESWNWLNWLTDETLVALNMARELRNQRAHGLAMANPEQDWQQLYQALRCVMDMASYWAMHPLCMAFQSGRDGMRAQVVASTEMLMPVKLLDTDIAVPPQAEADVFTCWQPLWRNRDSGHALDENTPPEWTSVMVSWAHWIERDTAGAVWLKVWSKPGLTEWLDLVSGQTRRVSST